MCHLLGVGGRAELCGASAVPRPACAKTSMRGASRQPRPCSWAVSHHAPPQQAIEINGYVKADPKDLEPLVTLIKEVEVWSPKQHAGTRMNVLALQYLND